MNNVCIILLHYTSLKDMKYISFYKLFRLFVSSILRVKKGNMWT